LPPVKDEQRQTEGPAFHTGRSDGFELRAIAAVTQ